MRTTYASYHPDSPVRTHSFPHLGSAVLLGPSYGLYSGVELTERTPAAPGADEYLDAEKCSIRPRDWDAPGNIKAEIARLNQIRREYPALQHNHDLWFLPIQNDQVKIGRAHV